MSDGHALFAPITQNRVLMDCARRERSAGCYSISGVRSAVPDGQQQWLYIRFEGVVVQPDGIGDARPPASLALPIAAVAIAGTTYGATLNDPLAFTPGTHADAGDRSGGAERGEHGDD